MTQHNVINLQQPSAKPPWDFMQLEDGSDVYTGPCAQESPTGLGAHAYWTAAQGMQLHLTIPTFPALDVADAKAFSEFLVQVLRDLEA